MYLLYNICTFVLASPPPRERYTSCDGKTTEQWSSLQSAWDDCMQDPACYGVYENDCDDSYWRLCYDQPKSSSTSCKSFYNPLVGGTNQTLNIFM